MDTQASRNPSTIGEMSMETPDEFKICDLAAEPVFVSAEATSIYI